MEEAAENLNFEKAALLRDQIAAIRKLNAGQNVINENLQSHDFIAVAGAGKNCCVSVLRFRKGKLMDKKEHVFFGEESRYCESRKFCCVQGNHLQSSGR